MTCGGGGAGSSDWGWSPGQGRAAALRGALLRRAWVSEHARAGAGARPARQLSLATARLPTAPFNAAQPQKPSRPPPAAQMERAWCLRPPSPPR